jgi:hypothetical protein
MHPYGIHPTLDALRRKRNVGLYEDYGLVSQSEADECGKMAIRVRRDAKPGFAKTLGHNFLRSPPTVSHTTPERIRSY